MTEPRRSGEPRGGTPTPPTWHQAPPPHTTWQQPPAQWGPSTPPAPRPGCWRIAVRVVLGIVAVLVAIGFIGSALDSGEEDRQDLATDAEPKADPEAADATPSTTAATDPTAPAAWTLSEDDYDWVVEHRHTLVAMARAVENLGHALGAKDDGNIARFSGEISAAAGEILASRPPGRVKDLTRTAMHISGAATEAYITDDYTHMNNLFELYRPVLADVVAALPDNDE